MKILFHNVDGLLRNQRNLELTQIFNTYDIIGFVETWLPANIDFKSHNHKVLNNSREKKHPTGRVSGGTSLLISNHSKLSVNKLESESKKILWAEIQLKNNTIILGIAYNPPQNSNHYDTNIFHTMEKEIDKFEEKYDDPKLIILADFNARIGNKDTLPCITSAPIALFPFIFATPCLNSSMVILSSNSSVPLFILITSPTLP